MTKKSLKHAFVIAVFGFIVLIAVGSLISYMDSSKDRVIFGTFKDLLPLVLGIAGVWLGYCVQSRASYQQQLRCLWTRLVEVVHGALQYCHLKEPKEEQYSEILARLRVALDEVRGVFCNLGEGSNDRGLYPFEPLKTIHQLVEGLGYGPSFSAGKASDCRNKIWALWKDVRKEILKEFDRDLPSFPHSHWRDLEKARVYDENEIPKIPS